MLRVFHPALSMISFSGMPAVSLESSAQLRINSSKRMPILAFETLSGMQIHRGELFSDEVEQFRLLQAIDLGRHVEGLQRCRRSRTKRRVGSVSAESAIGSFRQVVLLM